MLTREQLLGAQEVFEERVFVPMLEGEVVVRSLDAETYSKLVEDSQPGDEGKKPFMVRMIIASTYGDDGNRLFRDGDAGKLCRKPAKLLRPIYDAACKINYFGENGAKEAEKNSPSPPSECGTSSPSASAG